MKKTFALIVVLLLAVVVSAVGAEFTAPRLSSVEITGIAPADRARLLDNLGLRPGARLDSVSVSAALERLVRFHADRGYPFCTARLTGLSLSGDNRAALQFEVQRGRLVHLGRVDIAANTTRPRVLDRLAGIAPGDPYSERALQLATRRLIASGLFRRVDTVRISQGRTLSTVDVRLAAEEFPASRLEAALGGGGSNGQGVAGLVGLRMANLFGTARSAIVRWQRPGRDWQSLELGYREPWLAGSPLALEFTFSQQLRDSLFTQTEAALALEADLSAGLAAGLGAIYGSASPGSDTWELAESSRLWALTGMVRWSSLLAPLNPADGLRISATGSVGRRRMDGRDLREVRARVSGEFYRRLGLANHVAAISGGAAVVGRGNNTPGEIPWHARIPVGGTLAGGVPVRGHAEEETRASRAGWLSVEYRFLTGEASRVFAFYDLAVIERARSTTAGWQTAALHGLGGGIQADTRLGLLEIAVAVDPERGPGEGRLHLRLVESF